MAVSADLTDRATGSLLAFIRRRRSNFESLVSQIVETHGMSGGRFSSPMIQEIYRAAETELELRCREAVEILKRGLEADGERVRRSDVETVRQLLERWMYSEISKDVEQGYSDYANQVRGFGTPSLEPIKEKVLEHWVREVNLTAIPDSVGRAEANPGKSLMERLQSRTGVVVVALIAGGIIAAATFTESLTKLQDFFVKLFGK